MGLTQQIKVIDPIALRRVAQLGFPIEDQAEAARALKEYQGVFDAILPKILKRIHGAAIYHAVHSAHKHTIEVADRAVELFLRFNLDPADISHIAEADKRYGVEAATVAVEAGYRRRDIFFAAGVLKEWGHVQEGREHLEKLRKLSVDWHVDLHEEDIRYAAVTLRNLGEELLRSALRDRHPKSNRENWLRGASIALVAWAYRLSAPHVGEAIDNATKRGIRREKIGHHVLGVLSGRFGRTIQLPPWL